METTRTLDDYGLPELELLSNDISEQIWKLRGMKTEDENEKAIPLPESTEFHSLVLNLIDEKISKKLGYTN